MPIPRDTLERGTAFLIGDDTLSYEAFSNQTIESAVDRAAREISLEARCVEEDGTLIVQQSTQEIILDGSLEGGSFLGRPVDLIKVWIDRGDGTWEELVRMNADARPTYPYEGPPDYYWFNPWNGDLGGPSIGFQYVPDNAYSVRIWAKTTTSPSTEDTTALPVGAELAIQLRATRHLRAMEGDAKTTAELDRWMSRESYHIRRSKSGESSVQG